MFQIYILLFMFKDQHTLSDLNPSGENWADLAYLATIYHANNLLEIGVDFEETCFFILPNVESHDTFVRIINYLKIYQSLDIHLSSISGKIQIRTWIRRFISISVLKRFMSLIPYVIHKTLHKVLCIYSIYCFYLIFVHIKTYYILANIFLRIIKLRQIMYYYITILI